MPADRKVGVSYAVAAYLFWGVAPIYFVWVAFAQPLEILAYRLLWSLPLLAIFASIGRQWSGLRALSAADFRQLAICAALLAVNWLTFIYGVVNERINETSLGYFINPLISIALGAIVLGERLSRGQWIAVAVSGFGVCFELAVQGTLPWISLVLALTFGLYGLLRKQVAVPAALGLGIESGLFVPVAAAYLLFADLPSRDVEELGLLALGGLVTVLPLVWFAAAATRLPLTLLGFFQYIAPSLSLLVALGVYGETISSARWVSFGCVWLAIVIFTFSSLRQRQQATA